MKRQRSPVNIAVFYEQDEAPGAEGRVTANFYGLHGGWHRSNPTFSRFIKWKQSKWNLKYDVLSATSIVL